MSLRERERKTEERMRELQRERERERESMCERERLREPNSPMCKLKRFCLFVFWQNLDPDAVNLPNFNALGKILSHKLCGGYGVVIKIIAF